MAWKELILGVKGPKGQKKKTKLNSYYLIIAFSQHFISHRRENSGITSVTWVLDLTLTHTRSVTSKSLIYRMTE